MKTYIAPEIIEIEVNASELIATSPKDPDSKTMTATLPGQGEDVTKESDFAAPSYRSSLWND